MISSFLIIGNTSICSMVYNLEEYIFFNSRNRTGSIFVVYLLIQGTVIFDIVYFPIHMPHAYSEIVPADAYDLFFVADLKIIA